MSNSKTADANVSRNFKEKFMITDQEKEKITAEEIYRDEVKKSLVEKNQKSNSFWKFLNTGLGIWFLSTVVIGLISLLYTNYKEDQKISNDRDISIKQIDEEIESRISQFWVNLEPLVKLDTTSKVFTWKDGISSDTLKAFWNAFKNPPSFNPKLMTSINKDYEGRTIISLMKELRTLLEQKNKSKEHSTIDNIKSATVFIAGNGIFYNKESPTINEIWALFNEKIIIKRWDTLFPYTDCLFC